MATKLQKASIAIRQNKGRDLSPKWDDTIGLDSDAFHRHFHQAMTWYRLESSVKELKPKVIDWMGRNDYTKGQIQAFKKTKDNRCNLTMGAIAASLIKGMPDVHPGFRDGRSTVEWLKDAISKVVSEGRDDIDEDAVVKVEKPAVYVPSIQERLRDAAGAMSEDIDYAIDNFITDPEAFDPKAFKMISLLRGKGVKAAHARIIKGFFQFGHSELQELAGGSADEQLKEAYSHLPRKHVRKLIDFYESIMTACDQIAAEQKVLKQPRAKKIKPAEELVKKIKFKVTDDKLGIASVPAAQIVGAQFAVVYNTKTRKLGVYTAKTSEGLGVKGASIINFTDKSSQKTLRKPDVQLKEFKEQNTANRVVTWFGKIKATEVKLNGRVNAEIMILKTFK